VNTDQAFELLKDAGVAEDVGILTVRRWLLERKVKYAPAKRRETKYILDDTDQAINLLMDAGVASSTGMEIVKRWLREGRIQNVGEGKQLSEYISNEIDAKQYSVNLSNQERVIRQLKAKLKAQDEHLKGLEELHQNSVSRLLQQKEKYQSELVHLENEKRKFQRETSNLTKENIELRKELLRLKEELYKGHKSEPEKVPPRPSKPHDYRQKLGLSKTASPKEVVASYKKLLKITHPDSGGNEAAFHYIKSDYDQFRNSMK
jgi:chromosome segregation ATPase